MMRNVGRLAAMLSTTSELDAGGNRDLGLFTEATKVLGNRVLIARRHSK
jgi:hypothetical protein